MPSPAVEALLQAAGDDGEAGPVERLGDRGELGDDVLAVAPLLEQAEHAGQLALGALDAVDDRRHLGRGRAASVDLLGEVRRGPR